MEIERKYAVSGLVAGIAFGLLSFTQTVPIFVGLFGFTLFASLGGFVPMLGGPVFIFLVIVSTSYRFGKKVGRRAQADITNYDGNVRRAQTALLGSFLFFLIACIYFLYQAFAFVSFYRSVGREGAGTIAKTVMEEQSFRTYAAIGEISAKFAGPYTELQGVNSVLTRVSLYKSVEVVVPIAVQHSGNYRLIADYGTKGSSGIYSSVTEAQTQNQFFQAGEHVAHFTFINSSGWPAETTDSAVKVELSYLATRAELEASFSEQSKNVSPAYQKLYELAQKQMQSDGSPQTVSKFIESKEVPF